MKKSPILAAVLLVTACAGSPDNHYFTLSAVAPSQAPARNLPPIHLTAVRLPELYDRPQMVTRTGPQSVDIAEYDRWAEPLERMATRVLAQDVTARRPGGGTPTSVPLAATILIDEFGADRSGTARLSGTWKIIDSEGTARGGAFSFTEPSGGDPAAAAAAMSALLGKLADDIDRR